MHLVRGIIFGAVLVVITNPGSTQDLYAINSASDELYRIDIDTATPTLVGALGVSVSGCAAAFDGSGTLWALMRTSSPVSDDLYTIDLTSGAATHVVQVDIVFASRGVAFGPDGTLYGISSSGGISDLYSIDTSTGVTTHVGTMPTSGVIASFTGAAGYGYYCLVVSDLHTVDLMTAGATLVGPSLNSATLAFNPIDGYLYLVNGNTLHRADPSDGTTTSIGALGVQGGWTGSAFERSGTIPVDTRAWSEVKALFR